MNKIVIQEREDGSIAHIVVSEQNFEEMAQIAAKGLALYDQGMVELANRFSGEKITVPAHVACLVDFIYGYDAAASLPFTAEQKRELFEQWCWAREFIMEKYPDAYMTLID